MPIGLLDAHFLVMASNVNTRKTCETTEAYIGPMSQIEIHEWKHQQYNLPGKVLYHGIACFAVCTVESILFHEHSFKSSAFLYFNNPLSKRVV